MSLISKKVIYRKQSGELDYGYVMDSITVPIGFDPQVAITAYLVRKTGGDIVIILPSSIVGIGKEYSIKT